MRYHRVRMPFNRLISPMPLLRVAFTIVVAAILSGTAAWTASIVFGLGDSITFSEADLRYIPSAGDRGYVGKFDDILDTRNGAAPRPTVINLAIDGETADSFLDGTGRTPPVVGRTDSPLAQQNLNYAGDTIDAVTITLGFNELGQAASREFLYFSADPTVKTADVVLGQGGPQLHVDAGAAPNRKRLSE